MAPIRLINQSKTLFAVFCLAVGVLRAGETYERYQDGYRVLGIENGYWTIEVVQGLGGKVISLQDQITGREWLWSRHEDRHLPSESDAEVFGEGNLIGSDEIFPNLRSEPTSVGEFAGHGALWSRSVAFDAKAWDAGTIQMSIDLEALPLTYERSISLEASVANLHYRVHNFGAEPVAYLWALHPLFSVEPGDQFHIQDMDGPLLVETAPGVSQLKQGSRFIWPGHVDGIDLSELSLGGVPKAGIKFFTTTPIPGQVSLSNATSGASLQICYETESLPYLAVWLSRGVWGNAHHIAIEPTNRPDEFRSTSNAANEPEGWLLPGETREWTLQFKNLSQSEP